MPESVKYRPSKVNLRCVKPMDLDGYGERPIDNALDFMVWRTMLIGNIDLVQGLVLFGGEVCS